MRLASVLISLVLLASCSEQLLQRKPASPLTLRYRTWSEPGSRAASVSTSIYRDLLAKSMYSKCQMVPHDSQFFDTLVKRCGGFHAVFRSAARLFLERAASTDFLRPVRIDGQLKWLDLIGSSSCE